ncbi:unnamed protein product [Calicophoron daubneyi]|uniref:Autophagy-related protein 13 n=1 Tax=Calicophoron daubneyi TaxID=300641 RepID=A0AAV2TSY4_CALDB
MEKRSPRHEEKSAIENCIRSFIIKSIHAIVQARNGIVYNTNCISAVGARNNLMVNIEEDPEIGATIKQTLDAGFLVHVGDLLSLEILTAWPNGYKMVVEVWQFRLDTAEKLDSPSAPAPSHTPSPVSEKCSPPGSSSEDTQAGEVAVEDFKRSRLFEKLGTLLKAVVVVTRLLPGYQLSRRQDPTKYQMWYTLRRGPSELARLGVNSNCQQVGRLFSGLAVKRDVTDSTSDTHPVSDGSAKGVNPTGLTPNGDLLGVFLNVTVHYRTQIQCGPNADLVPLLEGMSKITMPPKFGPQDARDRSKSGRGHFPCETASKYSGTPRPLSMPDSETVNTNKLTQRVRPAFAEDGPDDEMDDFPDPAGPLLQDQGLEDSAPDYWLGGAKDFDDDGAGYSEDTDGRDAANGAGAGEHQKLHNEYALHAHRSRNSEGVNRNSSDLGDDDEENEPPEHSTTPLQLPFSMVGASGSRLTRLFVDLRERANLDLFKVPPSNLATSGTAQSSLFDADALADELERHEKMLKEFDDFLADFSSMELFGPGCTEVRPLAGTTQPTAINPRMHLGTEPS